ncbi:hypothetical protein [Polyangium jinanense]|uniref:PGRS family protein n=1 Tax=Polyangium jinanense TaxID=2829994 RepID=A0A9X3X757_9BACT|nr:hypothetical protein [Polyangium jinanense]MDC3957289.1 hypothetical protein [Polyangium jinanense]MDC3982691.1 hypothetical protein [Polyangium jinanense]
MRTRHAALASLGILIAASFWQMAGCSLAADDCSRNNTCAEDGKPYQGGAEVPEECRALPSAEPSVIKDECGVFVSALAADGGDGTKAKPFKSLQAAVDKARTVTARIYACADGDYAERVDVPAGVSIFGGFDCQGAEWNYDTTKKARINPPEPASPDEVQASLRVVGAQTTRLEDLRIEAANATLKGGSAIALIVDGATVNFVRTELIAGNGNDGAQGVTPTDDIGPSDPDDLNIRGNSGQNACMGGAGGNPGGAAKANPICNESSGGKGGNGQETSGDVGGDGIPAPNPNPNNRGVGGLGDTGAGDCETGQPGANGTIGSDGAGGMNDGALDASKGHIGVSGQPGGKGTIGQGGGGGGGSKGKSGCFGASGGGGGAGGCGGNGGFGGMAGGSSIGIVSIGATLSFQMVGITTGAGGYGGDGGFGQAGGNGGNGGNGGSGATMGGATPYGCNGGPGGNGGDGGTGGGGRGGHSLGIAYRGGNVSEAGATITTGTAGPGGMGGGAMGGVQAPLHGFP